MSKKYEMDGAVIKIGDVESFNAGFTKLEFVIETRDQHPQQVKFELIKDKTSLIDAVQIGQEVTVHFDIQGRAWNDKHFVNLQAWRIEAGEQTQAQPDATESVQSGDDDTRQAETGQGGDEDNLPF
jgi:hypothetical protein